MPQQPTNETRNQSAFISQSPASQQSPIEVTFEDIIRDPLRYKDRTVNLTGPPESLKVIDSVVQRLSRDDEQLRNVTRHLLENTGYRHFLANMIARLPLKDQEAVVTRIVQALKSRPDLARMQTYDTKRNIVFQPLEEPVGGRYVGHVVLEGYSDKVFPDKEKVEQMRRQHPLFFTDTKNSVIILNTNEIEKAIKKSPQSYEKSVLTILAHEFAHRILFNAGHLLSTANFDELYEQGRPEVLRRWNFLSTFLRDPKLYSAFVSAPFIPPDEMERKLQDKYRGFFLIPIKLPEGDNSYVTDTTLWSSSRTETKYEMAAVVYKNYFFYKIYDFIIYSPERVDDVYNKLLFSELENIAKYQNIPPDRLPPYPSEDVIDKITYNKSFPFQLTEVISIVAEAIANRYYYARKPILNYDDFVNAIDIYLRTYQIGYPKIGNFLLQETRKDKSPILQFLWDRLFSGFVRQQQGSATGSEHA